MSKEANDLSEVVLPTNSPRVHTHTLDLEGALVDVEGL